MCGSTPPPAPDVIGAANATAENNKEMLDLQTIANRPNQTGPFGSVDWTKNGATGQWTQNTTVDPALMGALGDQLSIQSGRSATALDMLGQVQAEAGAGLDWNNVPVAGMSLGGSEGVQGRLNYGGAPGLPTAGAGMTSGVGTNDYVSGIAGAGGIQTGVGGAGQGIQSSLDYTTGAGSPQVGEAARNDAEQALYRRQTMALDPRFAQQQGAMEAQLRNQGLSPGSMAWDRAATQFGQTQNDAYAKARLDAIAGGGAEQQRQFGMDLSARQQNVNEINNQGQFANAAQGQGFNQMMGAGQFGNAAQAQQYGQNANDSTFFNQAMQQNFNQNLAGAQFGNQAQNQNFTQGMAGRQQTVGEINQMAAFQNQAALQQQQMDQNQAAWQNQLRQQGIADQQVASNYSLNQLNALLSGQQVQNPQFQGFSNAGYTAGADILGATNMNYQNQLSQFSAQQAANQGVLSGVTGMLGAAGSFMPSDERLKVNVTRLLAEAAPGIPFATYAWKDAPEKYEIGVIAQDVEKVMPKAVRVIDGVMHVDYSQVAPGYPREA